VTLAEAIPVQGSGITLPLNLTKIATQCNGAYFAPKRFAAVQLAYTNPRCRILVFRKSMHSLNPYTHTLGSRL
jgi:TATA-box binding protein (TBP) (component of TFIID and TFIIIB)